MLAGIVMFLYQINNSQSGQQAEIITYSTDKPDEGKPGDDHVWQGGSEDPKYIKLPTIGAEGFVQNVGVDQNQQVAVPNNIHIAGWFVDSVKPGNKGLSIIDGHVDGRQNPGIFMNLVNLKENDLYTVEFGDGSVKQFRVIGVTSVETAKAANILFSQSPKVANQLNLITCGGTFDHDSQRYDKRVIVYSELVK